jgi:hypothetical protein
VLGAAQLPNNARARSHLNFSPVLSTPYGFTQLGGLLKPTAVSVRVICLMG